MLVEKIKRNWLTIVLVAVIVVLVSQNIGGLSVSPAAISGRGGLEMAKVSTMGVGMAPPYIPEAAPVESSDRLVIRNTNLSLKVNDVRKAIDGISAIAQGLGGFMVDSSLDIPEGGATGNISVRIPSDKLDQGLVSIRALGVKVVSENVVGTDVTSEYVDIEARLSTLLKTKAKFEQIMESAVRIEDLLNVQRELINLQSQIDSLRGQQKYLTQTSKLSLVTVYLATDELALPFAPEQPWRPSVIFKQAVRSLVGSARGLGTALIWIVVYAPVWLPVLLLVWWLKRRKR